MIKYKTTFLLKEKIKKFDNLFNAVVDNKKTLAQIENKGKLILFVNNSYRKFEKNSSIYQNFISYFKNNIENNEKSLEKIEQELTLLHN